MYTCMQTNWFQMSPQHCRHCMPSVDVTIQAHFSTKGKKVFCKLMRSSQSSTDSFLGVGVSNHVTDDILSAVEQFICTKNGKPTASTVNDVWYEVFHSRFHHQLTWHCVSFAKKWVCAVTSIEGIQCRQCWRDIWNQLVCIDVYMLIQPAICWNCMW